MRRWNGWGDDTVTYPLTASGARFLKARMGPGRPPSDISFEDVLAQVPPSRLPSHPLVTPEAGDRVSHARGQSLPDWIALRAGRIGIFPDGVAYPATDGDVRLLIRYAREVGAKLIPYGGGTSVVGHVNPIKADVPVLTVDLRRLNSLREWDETSRLATFGAGVSGPDLEARLRAHGYTLGHFPQSFEYSTLGGWVATRSSGQQSMGYGRIESLFAGGRLEAPAGNLEIPAFPASAAGPDPREMVLGSEGLFGVLTEVTVRVSTLPKREEVSGVFFPDFERGLEAVRAITQAGLHLSMLRLSNPCETETALALSSHERLVSGLRKFLAIRGIRDGMCLLLLGFSGKDAVVWAARKEARAIARGHKGMWMGRFLGKQWQRDRFRAPYLRNTLWEMGYAVDTVETACNWSRVPAMIDALESALHSAHSIRGGRAHVFTHLSHLYPQGSSIYTTYLFSLDPDPEENLKLWGALKSAASKTIIEQGGTISHHHGIGIDHAPYVVTQKGALGMAAIQDLCRRFDPEGIMNPGKLIPIGGLAKERI